VNKNVFNSFLKVFVSELADCFWESVPGGGASVRQRTLAKLSSLVFLWTNAGLSWYAFTQWCEQQQNLRTETAGLETTDSEFV